jgi:hypothetical protein
MPRQQSRPKSKSIHRIRCQFCDIKKEVYNMWARYVLSGQPTYTRIVVCQDCLDKLDDEREN